MEGNKGPGRGVERKGWERTENREERREDSTGIGEERVRVKG